jgi:hypothetical protein
MSVLIAFFTENFWATAALLGSMSTAIAGAINGKLNPNAIWRQVIAWAVAIVLTVGTYFLGLIQLANPVWLTMIATGLIVGLVSNGVYDIPFIKGFIQRIFGEIATVTEQKQ